MKLLPYALALSLIVSPLPAQAARNFFGLFHSASKVYDGSVYQWRVTVSAYPDTSEDTEYRKFVFSWKHPKNSRNCKEKKKT